MRARRRLIVGTLGTLLSIFAPLASRAQRVPLHHIGFLAARARSTPSHPDVYYDAFVQGMRDLGYVEGTTLAIEWRYANGKSELLDGLAAELVRLKIEVLVAHSTAGAQAAKRATSTIPIVTAAVSDPVIAGLAATLAHPGGNITGLSDMSADVSPKRLELLHAMMPRLSNVALLLNPDNSVHPAVLKSVQAAAKLAGIRVLWFDARTPQEIERAFASMSQERAEALIIAADGFFIGQSKQIASLALKHRLPSISHNREYVVAGGLMSYGQNLTHLYRRAANFVDLIFKGAKAGDLPFEQPTAVYFAINRKTTAALGLAIPAGVQLRADELIDQ